MNLLHGQTHMHKHTYMHALNQRTGIDGEICWLSAGLIGQQSLYICKYSYKYRLNFPHFSMLLRSKQSQTGKIDFNHAFKHAQYRGFSVDLLCWCTRTWSPPLRSKSVISIMTSYENTERLLPQIDHNWRMPGNGMNTHNSSFFLVWNCSCKRSKCAHILRMCATSICRNGKLCYIFFFRMLFVLDKPKARIVHFSLEREEESLQIHNHASSVQAVLHTQSNRP